jgi:threonine synthase
MEPTSATGPAAFSRLSKGGVFEKDALVIVPITGAGFKTTDKYAVGIRSEMPDKKLQRST